MHGTPGRCRVRSTLCRHRLTFGIRITDQPRVYRSSLAVYDGAMIHRIVLLLALAVTCACAQTAPPTSGDQLLQQALHDSTLSGAGIPFHAVLDISPQATGYFASPGPAYSGRIEVWWHDPSTYRLAITSPSFTLQRTVASNNISISETHTGDFYPRWLENFALALTGPLPVDLFTATAGGHFSNYTGAVTNTPGSSTQSCIRRDDRVNGITNDLTWGNLCIYGPAPRLQEILTFNRDLEFYDWHEFGRAQIPRTFKTYVLAFQSVVGELTTLEPLSQSDAATLVVTNPTPQDQRIQTALVSTLKGESLIDHAPTIQWPPVHEGKTDGYMIVYARTDRTGQVRETAKHNSDNAELEDFGIQQALSYKFKPLLIDGVAVQMEMPLVLHFTSHLQDPTPILTIEQMKQQVIQCNPIPIPRHPYAGPARYRQDRGDRDWRSRRTRITQPRSLAALHRVDSFRAELPVSTLRHSWQSRSLQGRL